MKRIFLFAAFVLLPVVALAARLPRDVFPVHYDLIFRPNLQSETFTGSETITVSVQRPTREIILHSLEIEFKSVSIESDSGSGLEKQTADVKLEPLNEFAVLTTAQPIKPGPAKIRIEYAGKLNRELRGFYIGDFGSGSAAQKYAASQGESVDIRRAFPCFDEPAMKATFSISMIVDKTETAISNNPVESDTPGPGPNQHTIRFAATPRLSSYLVALTVGDFRCISGDVDRVQLRICALGDGSALGNFALETTKGVVGYFDSYYGIPYPFAKLDQIGIPDFSAGAMENAGAIIYRESALLSDPKSASLSRRKGIAATISHEIAHMWFGDLVTMQWWNDVWLNEGFATWMESKPLQKMHPEWRYDLENMSDTNRAMDKDVLATTRTIRANAETSREIDALFDSIAYEKTASLLRMIESYMGEENFRTGVNAYLKSHAFGNAESYDFLDALASVSKNSADQVMNEFVNQPGVPVVSVDAKCEGKQTAIRLRQRRFFADSKKEDTHQQWTIPVCFASEQDCRLLNVREQTIHVDGCKPATFINRNGSGYFITEYDPASQKELLRQTDGLSEAERMAFQRDEWYLMTAGIHPIGNYLQLAEALKKDETPELLRPLIENLQYTSDYLTTPGNAAAFQDYARALLDPAHKTLGLAASPNETEERRLARGYVLKSLAVTGKDPDAIAAVRKMADSYFKDRSSVDPDIVDEILEGAARSGDEQLYQQVLEAYRSGGTPEEKRRFLETLGSFRDRQLLERTLKFALSSEIRKQDADRLIAGVMRNPAGAEIGWNFVKEHWTEITSKFSDAMLPSLVSATASLCDAAKREDVQSFFTQHKVSGADRDLAQSLEKISVCVDTKSIQQKNLSAWLSARPKE